MLARVIQWMPYATIVIDGRRYVTKTHAELATEITLPSNLVG